VTGDGTSSEANLAAKPDAGATVNAYELVALYADLGRRIDALTGPDDAMAAITAVAVEAVPGADHASITRSRGDRFQTLAPTSVIATAADRLQYELNSGPCIYSVRTGESLLVPDIAHDPRWPQFGPLVAERFGIGSMLSLQMVLDDEITAGLNLYSNTIGGFTPRSETIGMLLTTHGAVAVNHVVARERAEHLETALANSRRIGIAIGVLMSARKLTNDQAFDLMRIVSQNTNRRMVLVAEDVIETGTIELPGAPGV
jgi:GAF domain-containing protein